MLHCSHCNLFRHSNNFAITPPSQATARKDSPVDDWKLYRTRFLAKAKRLDESCTITDIGGRVQQGAPGDYLVEAPDGSQRIAPAHVFEDIYVEFEAADARLERRKTFLHRPLRACSG
jgi:hypothetical protein